MIQLVCRWMREWLLPGADNAFSSGRSQLADERIQFSPVVQDG